MSFEKILSGDTKFFLSYLITIKILRNIKPLDLILKQLQFLLWSSSCPIKSEPLLCWSLSLRMGSNVFWTLCSHKDNPIWDKKNYKQDKFLSKCTIVQHVRPRFFLSHKLDHWANYVYLPDSGIMTGRCVSFLIKNMILFFEIIPLSSEQLASKPEKLANKVENKDVQVSFFLNTLCIFVDLCICSGIILF